MNLRDRYLVKPGKKVWLKDHDPDDTAGMRENDAEKLVKKHREKLAKLQQLLYAEHKHALLIVLQAMDAGGKDGTIRHVMSGVNPQGCSVTSFKVPSAEESDHDFLWRIHKAVPGKGQIGIFNRSQYEEVLVVRVHNLAPKSHWSKAYAQINAFEKILAENEVNILKFFLHIGKDEQKRRFEARRTIHDKNWKASPSDYEERKYWDDYRKAFEEALEKCSKPDAPWYIVPANHKWFRDVVVSDIVVKALEDLKMKYPDARPALPAAKGI
ncbi:MAG: polyphosphate kinase 2 family protein [Bryobacteraceae bacterium]